jgi:hypothetical protein
VKNNIQAHNPTRVSKQYARDLAEDVHRFKNLKPIWWAHYGFKYHESDEAVVKEFSNYCVRVARQTGAHIYPVYSIGRIQGSRPHIHCVLCADRYVNYRDVHIWRSGNSEQTLYKDELPGIEYLCDYSRSHRLVIGVSPFCPNKGSCRRRGCVYARGREC